MSTQPVTGATRPVAVDIADITGTRATDPGAIARGWAARTRRPLLADDGRMLLVAADHPARGALGVRGDRLAMASRSDLLRRLATALSRPGVDGVLGTPDVVEELLVPMASRDQDRVEEAIERFRRSL